MRVGTLTHSTLTGIQGVPLPPFPLMQEASPLTRPRCSWALGVKPGLESKPGMWKIILWQEGQRSWASGWCPPGTNTRASTSHQLYLEKGAPISEFFSTWGAVEVWHHSYHSTGPATTYTCQRLVRESKLQTPKGQINIRPCFNHPKSLHQY